MIWAEILQKHGNVKLILKVDFMPSVTGYIDHSDMFDFLPRHFFLNMDHED